MIPTCIEDKPKLEPVPLIIVEGFMSSTGSTTLWGDFEQSLNRSCKGKRRRVMFASVGPVSSLHDRACELYYTLRGGAVDYGEEHSKIHHHARYGRTYTKGFYPQWSHEHPLHFLGHSLGGPTITKLQFLLKHRYFDPCDHPNMMLSVNTMSAPFRGTQLVYTLGERTDAAPAVRPLSIGSLLAKWVHVVTFLSPFLPDALDLHAEARTLSFRETSVISLLKQLWKSDWAEGRDAAPFDVTFEAADERESKFEGEAFSGTFYRSHAVCMEDSSNTNSSASLKSIISLPLYLTSQLMSSFNFFELQPKPSFLECLYPDSGLGEEYRANDGIVPIFSQWHPLPCRCLHLACELDVTTCKPESGVWHVNQVEEATHISFIPFWTGSSRQKQFWESTGHWLRVIDSTRI
ncbi:Lipase [Hypsizygus marmoreus]|uniref:Lipase n=1 Tax=Hypsizygus marmoreus TaxID=39966 RepID=A0A369K4Y5_HYPMA|nr:Lipase [Hypsizygus marmoreus]